MAGYLGTKAVFLSTTASSVTGNASVGGTLIANGLAVNGTIKLDGNYPVGTGNVALGDDALISTNSSAFYNTAIGSSAMASTTSGTNNTAVGLAAGVLNTTGSYNTAVGTSALYNNTTASNATAVGYQAAYSSNANYVTAMGRRALYSNTSGINAAFGDYAMYSTTTGSLNTVVGNEALQDNTTGSNNTAIGYLALHSNTTASDNTALGMNALITNTTGSQNTAVGKNALYTGTGTYNTAVGFNAGSDITTGSKNTIIGAYGGNQGGLDIRTLSNNIVLSDGDGNPRLRVTSAANVEMPTYIANNGATGSRFYNGNNGRDVLELDSTSTGSVGLIHFYNPNGFIAAITTSGTSVQYNTTSDYRLKENVVEMTGATERLKQIPVYRFNFKNDPAETLDGFLAHEVQEVVPEAVTGEKDAIGSDGTPRWQGIDQSKLVPLLVATIQELEARIAALEAN